MRRPPGFHDTVNGAVRPCHPKATPDVDRVVDKPLGPLASFRQNRQRRRPLRPDLRTRLNGETSSVISAKNMEGGPTVGAEAFSGKSRFARENKGYVVL